MSASHGICPSVLPNTMPVMFRTLQNSNRGVYKQPLRLIPKKRRHRSRITLNQVPDGNLPSVISNFPIRVLAEVVPPGQGTCRYFSFNSLTTCLPDVTDAILFVPFRFFQGAFRFRGLIFPAEWSIMTMKRNLNAVLCILAENGKS